jgi:starch phosphorylase
MPDRFTQEPRIAYFSMEIAIQNEIPTYSGGLGVLAGDTMNTCADLDLPIVAVTLVSRDGYFRQEINDQGKQTELPDFWEPSRWAAPLNAKIAVTIEGRRVWIGGWLYILEGTMKGRVPIILLDTNLEENSPEDRKITDSLYGGDEPYRLKQEIVLGIGGVRMLHALGFRIRHYHLNEGHSALLGLELLRRYSFASRDVRPGESAYDIPRVREICNFTTHTPIESAQDKFSYILVERILGDFIDNKTMKSLAGEAELNMTCLALNLSDYVNGVARRHAEISQQFYPTYRVVAITNGVHPGRWTHPAFAKIYDQTILGWRHAPDILVRVDQVSDEAVWEAHTEAKQQLIQKIVKLTGVSMELNIPILGFGRRMTGYKRPDLLFSDVERLKGIAKKSPFQVVLTGKAHPKDEGGKKLIETLHNYMRSLKGNIPIAYLPNYDMNTALAMVSGVDIWLNTPLRPLEASGTSGMKAAFNGVPSLSVLDGWWIEGCIEGVTGWAIGTDELSANGIDSASLYSKLEETVLPLYYKNRQGWIKIMKNAIGKNASFFNSYRMIRQYTSDAYIKSMGSY